MEQTVQKQIQLLDLASDAILVRGPEERIVYWNQGAERLYGWKKEEALGKDAFELLRTESPVPLDSIKERVRREEYWEGELRQQRRDGAWIIVNSRWTLQRDLRSNLQGWLQINTDVTARKQAEAAIRQLSGRILRLQDEERRRIARELHDSAGQKIAALSIDLAVLGEAAASLPAKAQEALAECFRLSEQVGREIRTLSYLLHPPLLDESGLASAIRWYVDGVAQRSGLQIAMDVPLDFRRQPREVETALFRVVQESLTNIHLHSGSKTAKIRLAEGEHGILLEVSDKGCGIPAGVLDHSTGTNNGLGVGIAGMRERVQQLGGQFQILSTGRGTTVRATLPLRRDAEDTADRGERQASA